jgi:hypothetical protein
MANKIREGGVEGMSDNIETDDHMFGAYIKHQAIGALPNSTRIRKIRSEFGDATPNGEEGRVLGSLAVPITIPESKNYGHIPYFYFVEWDHAPGFAIGVISAKLERV